MENGEKAFEGERLGTEQMPGDFAVFGGAAAGDGGTTFFFAARGKRGFAEDGGIVPRRRVGPKIGS